MYCIDWNLLFAGVACVGTCVGAVFTTITFFKVSKIEKQLPKPHWVYGAMDENNNPINYQMYNLEDEKTMCIIPEIRYKSKYKEVATFNHNQKDMNSIKNHIQKNYKKANAFIVSKNTNEVIAIKI